VETPRDTTVDHVASGTGVVAGVVKVATDAEAKLQKGGKFALGESVFKEKFQGSQYVDKDAVATSKLANARLATVNKVVGKLGGFLGAVVATDKVLQYINGDISGGKLSIELTKIAAPFIVGAVSGPGGIAVGGGILINDLAQDYLVPHINRGAAALGREMSTTRGAANVISGGLFDYFDFGIDIQ